MVVRERRKIGRRKEREKERHQAILNIIQEIQYDAQLNKFIVNLSNL
jgi:guanylate kinase